MSDPKLKAAMEEIKAILTKHDIVAVVFLSSPTSIEYLHQLQASWTCMRLETVEHGQLLRFRNKAADYPDKETRTRILRDSVGTVAGFADACRHHADKLEELMAQIGRTVAFEHMTKEEPPS